MDERRLLKPSGSKLRESRLNLCFFWMGSGSVVTYNALVMAVAHFRLNENGYGRNVLTQFALWHNVLLVGAMLLISLWPEKPSLTQHVALLLAAFGFGVAFNAALLFSAVFSLPPPPWALYAAMAVNGGATGVACSIGASLSGIIESYSSSKGPGVSQLRGASFGVALPTAVQLLTLPLVAISSVQTQTTLAAALSAGAALVLCGGAIASIRAVSRHEVFVDDDDNNDPAEYDTIGKCVSCGLKDFVKDRLKKVAPFASAQILNTFALVLMLLLSPRLPTTNSFWKSYMPTLAVASNNIFGYVGRSLRIKPPKDNRRVLAYVFCSPAGLAAIVATSYGQIRGVNPIVIYSGVALLSGRATVVFSQKAQEVCGHSEELACPIVAQLNFIGIESGALFAAIVLLVV